METTADEAQARLAALPRLHLAHLPTPLEEMPRLSRHLGGPRLLAKRDDLTGLGIGGNKLRKLEYDLAAAQAAAADCVVCGGVVQSNTARQAAAACAKLGLGCHLGIMRGRVPGTEPGYDSTGNILLDRLYGAVIHDIPWNEDRNLHLRRIADALAAAGRRPYLVPYGASDALGAMGYARMVLELLEQCRSEGVRPTYIVHASGSAGTQAGILAMLTALGHPLRCIGIDVDAQPERVARDVRRVGREAAALLGVEAAWDESRVEVAAGFAGPAYGVADAATLEAIGLAARLEAFALDPVYAGKGMSGLIGLVRRGRFQAEDVVVWIHTGGVPGIFAYPAAMARAAAR
ncbi:MAG TPA: D-cysteine desulfhydrase family protein [Alphaproteobacteria bacterium]|nr:D-cysteine desulfhydrase family protein [Alphaproteobacteria bacterium]